MKETKYRAVTSWTWEIKLKDDQEVTKEMDNGRLLWGGGGVGMIDSSVKKAMNRERPE